ncbi:MAG: lasso peptide [Chloroflexota bacterium]
MSKKTYRTPTLTVHGDVKKITLSGHVKNADLPGGADGTAFSP